MCGAVAVMAGDFVINGEYWRKSCLITSVECQEMGITDCDREDKIVLIEILS